MAEQCRFDMGYRGRCDQPALGGSGLCTAHAELACASCHEPATHECSYEGQFVCGAPLCDKCEGWNDQTKPSGAWGFFNHGHRPKHD